jgi:hypothetical protein
MKIENLTTKEQAQLLVDEFNFNCRECDNALLSAKITTDILIKHGNFEFPEDRLYWKSVRKELDLLK